MEAIGDLSFVLHGNEREPMIKGTPAVVARARALAKEGVERARKAQQGQAEEVLNRMRKTAQANPNWDDGMEDGIVMRREKDGYVFGFDPAHPAADRATELEYGTRDEPPSPVFRKVLHGQRSDIEWNFRQRMRRA